MGMSYAELGMYGRLRKVARCGPVAMYRACRTLWRAELGPAAVADKVGGGAARGRGSGAAAGGRSYVALQHGRREQPGRRTPASAPHPLHPRPTHPP